MSRIVVLLAGFLVLAAPGPSRAAFHVANIDEIMSGVGGDASAQYVEIRMLSGGQTFVAHSRLTAFSCDGSIVNVLLEVPANICNSAPTHDRWTMGTASWATVTGVTPDFTFAAGMFAPCGQICWGAPGTVPENPPTWVASNPNNYVDCVAYGGYTGLRQSTDAAATTAGPGDQTQSLQRMGDSNNDLADFMLATRTPTNNGTCPTTTTTTSTTTTTTLPDDTGSVPPDTATARCEGGVARAFSTYLRSVVSCHIRAADAAVKGAAVDDELCESNPTTGKGAKERYDAAIAKLMTKFSCGGCAITNAPGLRGLGETFLEQHNGDIYCAGTTPFAGGDDTGTVPPDPATGKCEDGVARAIAKYMQAVIRCHIKTANKGVDGIVLDDTLCESNPATGKGAKEKYDAAIAKLVAKPCSGCAITNAPGLRATAEAFLDDNNGQMYCAP